MSGPIHMSAFLAGGKIGYATDIWINKSSLFAQKVVQMWSTGKNLFFFFFCSCWIILSEYFKIGGGRFVPK